MYYCLKVPASKETLLKYLEYLETERVDYKRVFQTKEYILTHYSNINNNNLYYLCVMYDPQIHSHWLGLFATKRNNTLFPHNWKHPIKSITIF